MGTKRRLDAWMINRECEGGGDFGFWELYALQTKILEDRTKDRSCIFEALFKGVSTGFGLLLDEKLFENTLQTSRRQLVPFFSTISILNISTKMLTTNPG